MENKIYYRYVNKSEDGKNNFVLTEEKRPYKNCFPTKEEATKHFKESEKIAIKKYNKIAKEIEKIKKIVGNFSYDCDIFVYDDTGLETYIYMYIDVNGYDFKF